VRTPTTNPHAPFQQLLAVALLLAALIPAVPSAIEPAVHAEATFGFDTNPRREAGGEQGAYPFLGAIMDLGLAYGGERTALRAQLSEGARLFPVRSGADVSDADLLASRLDLDGRWTAGERLELGAALAVRDISERGGLRSETGGRLRLDAKTRLGRFDVVGSGGLSALYPRTSTLDRFASVGPDAGVEIGFSPLDGQRARIAWELRLRSFPRWGQDERDDIANGLVLEWSWRGPLIAGAGYGFTRNRSSVQGGSYLRHRVWFQAATALPWDITLAALGSLQRSTYLGGIVTDAERLLAENDERENALELRFSRPLGHDLELVFKAAAYLGEFSAGVSGDLLYYRREVIQLSIGWRPE
jgi:hypothetical protein